MARLKHPEAGTVIEIDGEQEEAYRASGWLDADEKPKNKGGRPKKTDDE